MDASAAPFVGRDGINWASLIAFTLFHIGAIAALFWRPAVSFLGVFFRVTMGFRRPGWSILQRTSG
jgi:hypothetical protein